ncbi:MAG: ferrochelatase [Legionellaceae bacterium]|nr:ferrochelatase [Legionellaceae bacterium]
MKIGLLLINLGTPDSPDTKSVRRYLREFLADKRVIDIPAVLRYMLLFGIILPFRSPKVAKAYASIWTKNGSPLRYYSNQLACAVQMSLGDKYNVALGMRYGKPSINDALKKLSNCNEIIILPLYPQYSSAASGSSIEYALKALAGQSVIPNIKVVRDFYNNPDYIEAQSQIIKPYLKNNEHILFSYHGLPENHLHKSGCSTICKSQCPEKQNQKNSNVCYRSQCHITTNLIAKSLGLSKDQYSIGFQSRLGRTEWIKPYTDKILPKLAEQGIKNLAIVCPSFVVDCLETLEEIKIQADQQWKALTNTNLTVIPCLNADPLLANSLSKITNSIK